ncbi:MAG: hypothetical protein MJ180_06600, partial [Candidatus Gastranaerophilales bacterium]|nr:hypothetical protein [Candidatus Gastranaerophilales bacterium]
SRDFMRDLLYYNTPGEDEENQQEADKIANGVEVLDTSVSASKPEEPVDPNHIKTAKDHFHDFLNYKKVEEPLTVAETVQLKVENQMDFVKLNNRANDFLIIGGKLYLLCADDYVVYVFDTETNKKIAYFELPKKGYYNSIKSSKDNTTGIITNISTKELLLFDTAQDKIIQKLPLTVNVHNVVITGRK